MQKVIYTDDCNPIVEDRIQSELHIDVIKRDSNEWNMQNSIHTITDPYITLAVFNTLDEISLLEIGVLLFLCKPILIADKAIEEYEILSKQVDYVDVTCNLKDPQSTFPSWLNYMEKI